MGGSRVSNSLRPCCASTGWRPPTPGRPPRTPSKSSVCPKPGIDPVSSHRRSPGWTMSSHSNFRRPRNSSCAPENPTRSTESSRESWRTRSSRSVESRAPTTAWTPSSGISLGDRMDLVESVRKAWVVTGLTLRYLMGTRRGIAMAVLAAVPLILTVGLAVARVGRFGIQLFQILLIPLFFQLVLIFVALVNASTLIRDEIEDNTLPYLLTRPISKPALIFYKYVAYLASALVLLVPPIVLAYGVTELHTESPFSADLDVLWGFLLATILGSAV